MNEQFPKVIRDHNCCNSPFEVKLECAKIEELEAIERSQKPIRNSMEEP